VNEYQRTRKLKNWGTSTPEIASRAETLAIEKILPKLGFCDFFHASALNRFVPFDIIATLDGQGVLIDVTTGVSKSVMHKFGRSIAKALGMPLYVLFIKPDFTKCQLVTCADKRTVQMRPSELVSIE
jgi:hypothetical protein